MSTTIGLHGIARKAAILHDHRSAEHPFVCVDVTAKDGAVAALFFNSKAELQLWLAEVAAAANDLPADRQSETSAA